jgi:hypothetical protein
MSLRHLFLRWISGVAMGLVVSSVASAQAPSVDDICSPSNLFRPERFLAHCPEQQPGGGVASAPAVPEGKPVWRFHGEVGGHFYTNSCGEGNLARGEYKMNWELAPNEAFFIEQSPLSGTHALYRFFDAAHIRHFYTTSSNAEGATNFQYEGVLGYIYQYPLSGTTALYRSYNPSSTDHFYTINKGEWENSFSSYSIDHQIIGYVPTGGTILCKPDNPHLRVYQHKPSTNWGEDAIDAVGNAIGGLTNGTHNSSTPASAGTANTAYKQCGNLRFGYDENSSCCCYNTSNNQYCTRPRNHPTTDTIEQCAWVCQNKGSCM